MDSVYDFHFPFYPPHCTNKDRHTDKNLSYSAQSHYQHLGTFTKMGPVRDSIDKNRFSKTNEKN